MTVSQTLLTATFAGKSIMKQIEPNRDMIKDGLEIAIKIICGQRDPSEKIGKLEIEFTDLATDPSRLGTHMYIHVHPAEMVHQIGGLMVEGTRRRETYLLRYDPEYKHRVTRRL